MNPTQARDRVIRIAPSDTDAALAAARGIDDPWFACQALAWVARYAPEERVEQVATQALKAGGRDPDPFRVVGSAAWPLRALVERNQTRRLSKLLDEHLAIAGTIENPASRSEALFLLYEAIFPAGRRRWQRVLAQLITASDPAVHRRQSRNLRDAILMAAREDPAFAAACTRQLQSDRPRRQLERHLAGRKYQTPRRFFWTTSA